MQSPATLVLKPKRDTTVRKRHPWIFSGAVDRVDGNPDAGDFVRVADAAGNVLGWAGYSPASQIRARMWSFADDETIDGDEIGRRVAAAATRRDSLWSSTNSARLVFSEADELPGVIADRYDDTIVVQFTTATAETHRHDIVDALAAVAGVTTVYERSDADVRDREGLDARVGLVRGDSLRADLTAHENGYRFAVDVAAGHKTGFYLDQRNARRLLPSIASGRRTLNVFSYTGSMSVIAAANGAVSVTSIDSSAEAMAGASRNAVLNDVELGETIVGDAFTELRKLRDRARQYDLIVVDPPKLANNERQLDKATRAYKDANLLALKLLAPGGLLLTFSCSGAMSMELFQKVIAGAARDAGRAASIIDRLHQPADHPVPLTFAEAEYLKGLVVSV